MRRAFSVAVYARKEQKILLILHKRLGTWLPVGGEVEMGETPFEAAQRELREETGLDGIFPSLKDAFEGVPAGYLGYEEHQAGSKGLHMNFVFVADVADEAVVTPNQEFDDFQWVDASQLNDVMSPLNVRQFGFAALRAAAQD